VSALLTVCYAVPLTLIVIGIYNLPSWLKQRDPTRR